VSDALTRLDVHFFRGRGAITTRIGRLRTGFLARRRIRAARFRRSYAAGGATATTSTATAAATATTRLGALALLARKLAAC